MMQVNEISREILDCLEGGHGDLTVIVDLLHRRKELITVIDDLLTDYRTELLTDEEEALLTGQFTSFREMHEQSQPLLKKLLESQLERLGGSAQRKKAEQKYRFSGEPDISYFSLS